MNVEPSRPIKKTKSRTPAGTPTKAKASTAAQARKPVSPCEEPHMLIAKRAYELYSERGYRHGYALNDWLDAEREILSRLPPP